MLLSNSYYNLINLKCLNVANLILKTKKLNQTILKLNKYPQQLNNHQDRLLQLKTVSLHPLVNLNQKTKFQMNGQWHSKTQAPADGLVSK